MVGIPAVGTLPVERIELWQAIIYEKFRSKTNTARRATSLAYQLTNTRTNIRTLTRASYVYMHTMYDIWENRCVKIKGWNHPLDALLNHVRYLVEIQCITSLKWFRLQTQLNRHRGDSVDFSPARQLDLRSTQAVLSCSLSRINERYMFQWSETTLIKSTRHL